MLDFTNMVAEFAREFLVGYVFGVLTFFTVYGCLAMFKAFKLPADVS